VKLRNKEESRWDLVSLGEVMLRLDPGDMRISTAREFRAWEGGGEYNVARGLCRTFGLKTAVVTALAENPIGRLVESLMLQGGVDLEHVRWVKYDGIGRTVRNGLNFTERGFGVRAALGCSDRGNTAVSHLKPGEIDWEKIFGEQGARWFHTGGIFCGLSETTPLVAERSDEGREETRRDYFLRPELSSFAVASRGRKIPSAAGESRTDAVCGCVVRQRRGFYGSTGIRSGWCG